MVSRQQSFLIAIATLATLAQPALASDPARKFYPDDPMWREPAPISLTQLGTRKVDDIYDFLDNTYATPRREGKEARRGPQPALDINTLGEVPDSPWYTNRHWRRRMSIAELQRGPGSANPPSPGDAWQVVGAKSDGVTPGFVIQDRHKNRYVLKFDPPQYPELCSAADVIGSKFFYALGYYTPENYVVRFRREHLTIAAGLTWRDASGRRHPLTERALDDMLRTQGRGEDGTYRALASKWIEGKVAGPFSYRGTRSDDPNDTIPHEDRRVLRGLAVFAAWLNHHDTRSINSMDTLVTEDGRQYVKHYLMDFGSILGSAGYGPKEPWQGNEYTIAAKETAVQMVTFGLYAPRWMRSGYPKLTGVGLFDSWSFDPLAWKPNYPNPAFLLMDPDDAFWAARQIASFTDEEIRAIVQTGEYSDPRAAAWIADCLIERRDKIVKAWSSRVLPVHNFRVVDGNLTYDTLGSAQAYENTWSAFDNDHRSMTSLPDTKGATIPGRGGEYLAARIGCTGSGCAEPVTVYLRRSRGSTEVVGVDR